MKKNIKNFCLILILLTLTACSSCKNERVSILGNMHQGLEGATALEPTVIEPSDSEILHTYNISLSNLNEHSIYAVASNQLVYHDRTSLLKFFDGSKSIITQKNEESKDIEIKDKKEIISFIPEFTPAPLIERSLEEMKLLENILFSTFNEGDIKTFYDAFNGGNFNATLRKRRVVKTKSLNIWVENSVWNNKINNATLEKIADMFLKDLKDDIYTWVTEIFGEEYYSSHNYINIINNNDINIVLYNINGSNPGKSRVLGYYHFADTYVKSFYLNDSSRKNSNEIIGFYLDAYSLSDTDEFWSDIAYSTIAHEFLHVIVFYQKLLKRGVLISNWLNEMLAMVTEDILSNKLKLAGPRGSYDLKGDVNDSFKTNGRLASSNKIDLNQLNILDYSNLYSFGSFLLRNFAVKENEIQINSLKLFRDIVQSDKNGLDAIEYALKENSHGIKSYDLVALWGKAMILSKNIYTGQEKYKYNGGENAFTANIGNTEHKIGSINLYNYEPNPKMYKINENPPNLNRASNILFELATNKSGSFSVNLDLPNYTKVEIIVLDKNGNYLPNYPVNVEKIQ